MPAGRSGREEEWVRQDTAERVRGSYRFRQERLRSRFDPDADPDADADGSAEDRSRDFQLRRELLEAERNAVLDLCREGKIDDDVMRRVVRDLDLEDARLDA